MVIQTVKGVVFLLGLAAMLGLNSTSGRALMEGQNSGTGPEVILTKLAPPVYPPIARAARVSGEVVITVLVRHDGSVDSEKVDGGSPMLQQAALDSASHSQFQCRNCDTGITDYKLEYLFTFVEGGDCCNSYGLPAAVEQKAGPSQMRVTIAAPVVCLCDPAATISRRMVRSVKCLWLWRCSARPE
jgi:TonB family protein